MNIQKRIYFYIECINNTKVIKTSRQYILFLFYTRNTFMRINIINVL
jgi:hypothetical protein